MSATDSNLFLILVILSLTIAITTILSGMLREHYQAKLEEKRIKLEMLKLASDLKDDQLSFIKHMNTVH